MAKNYKPKEKKQPEVAEPVVSYNTVLDSGIVASPTMDEATNELTEEVEELYAKLKSEADQIYGTNEYMTVEEYFGKLRYMVNKYYENVQS